MTDVIYLLVTDVHILRLTDVFEETLPVTDVIYLLLTDVKKRSVRTFKNTSVRSK